MQTTVEAFSLKLPSQYGSYLTVEDCLVNTVYSWFISSKTINKLSLKGK